VGRGAQLLVPWSRLRPGATVIEVPQAAVDLAKRFEGFHREPKSDPGRAHPYVCPAGFWTIGYGHLCDPTHPPISEDEAEAYLARDLVAALDATLRFCPVLGTEPEGRLVAILDFTFNLGVGRLQTSTLRRRIESAGTGLQPLRNCADGSTVGEGPDWSCSPASNRVCLAAWNRLITDEA